MRRPWSLLYGLLAYVLAVRSMVYLVAFLAGVWVAKTVDRGPAAPARLALLADLGLFLAFAVPHSLLARAAVKRRLERLLPPPLERSTYSLVAALLLVVLFWQWRPLPRIVWELPGPWRTAAWALQIGGWLLAVAAIQSLGHLRLFGLRQAWLHARDQPIPEPDLRTDGLYGRLRHPLYLGFFLACWGAPSMTQGRLLLAGVSTLYLALGIALEERELARRYGDRYRDYAARVPRFLPRWRS